MSKQHDLELSITSQQPRSRLVRLATEYPLATTLVVAALFILMVASVSYLLLPVAAGLTLWRRPDQPYGNPYVHPPLLNADNTVNTLSSSVSDSSVALTFVPYEIDAAAQAEALPASSLPKIADAKQSDSQQVFTKTSRTAIPRVPSSLINALNNRTNSPCLIYDIANLDPQPTIALTPPLLNMSCASGNTDGSYAYDFSKLPYGTNTNSLYWVPANLRGADLSDFSTSNSYLYGFNADVVPLAGASFSWSFMSGAMIGPRSASQSEDLRFMHCDISGGRLAGGFVSPILQYVNLTNARITQALFAGGTFNYVDAAGADFSLTEFAPDSSGVAPIVDLNAPGSTWVGAYLTRVLGNINMDGGYFQFPAGYAPGEVTLTINGGTLTIHASQVNADFWQVSNAVLTLYATNSTFNGSVFANNSGLVLQTPNSSFGSSQITNNYIGIVPSPNFVACDFGPNSTITGNTFVGPIFGNTHFDLSHSRVRGNTFSELTCQTNTNVTSTTDTLQTQGFFGATCTKVPPSCITAPKAFFHDNTFDPGLCPGKDHDGFKLSGMGIATIVIASVGAAAVLLCVAKSVTSATRSRDTQSGSSELFADRRANLNIQDGAGERTPLRIQSL